MSDIHIRLIEAAVRPLLDQEELKQSAADFLGQQTPTNAEATAMLRRWDEVDSRKGKSWWNIGLWLLVIVASAGMVLSSIDDVRWLLPWGKGVSTDSLFEPLPEPSEQAASKLNDADRLLLFGDMTKERRSERKQALWKSEPENPAYYADYAGAYIRDHRKLPPDYFEITRRIDPTNSWFTYLAAATEAQGAVKANTRNRKREKIGRKMVYLSAKEWEVLDQKRLDRCLDLIRQARDQPKYEDYEMDLLKKRQTLLPQDTLNEKRDSLSILSSTTVLSNIGLRTLGDVFYAKAWSLGESGDREGFQEICRDGELFLKRFSNAGPGCLVDGLVMAVTANNISEGFGFTAEKFGLTHDATQWKEIAKRLTDRKAGADSRKVMVDGKAVESVALSRGFLTSSIAMMVRQAENPPPLRDVDLKPMRMVENEWLSRIFSYRTWILMAIFLGLVASYRYYVGAMPRCLGRRMVDLLGQTDWLWIAGAGVLLPFFFVMVINQLTPLGGQAYGAVGDAELLPLCHFIGLVLLWLIVPPQIVRWRLAKIAGGFGFQKVSRIGWAVVAGAVAFCPLIGWAVLLGKDGEVLDWAAIFLLASSIGWVMIVPVITLWGRRDRRLYWAASSIVLPRVYPGCLLLLALASFAFHASERYWFKQDWMLKFDVENPGWSVYESKVATQMWKELRDILGDKL